MGLIFLLFLRMKIRNYCLNFILGSDSGNSIGQISNQSKSNEPFEWYDAILRSFVNNLEVDFGVVRPNDMEYLDICYDNYKSSLGWITYYSNEYTINIPNDLDGVEYEHTDTGKYLILTRDDFDKSPDTYTSNKNKLISLMEQISEKEPDYLV